MFELIESFTADGNYVGRHNLFFALRPSASEAVSFHRLGQQLRQGAGLTGSVTSADRLHVSLYGLGEHRVLPKHLVEAACEAGEKLVFPRFVVTFDCAGSFRGGRSGKWPFVLRSVHDIDALMLFYRALAMTMTRAGLRQLVTTQFTPHMTLLYDLQFDRPRSIEPACFVASELVLTSSLTGQGRHIQIARWPLRG